MIRSDVFIYNDKDSEFELQHLDTGVLVLTVDRLSVYLTDAQVKQLLSAIGKIYWELVEPLELVDPEEEYDESI